MFPYLHACLFLCTFLLFGHDYFTQRKEYYCWGEPERAPQCSTFSSIIACLPAIWMSVMYMVLVLYTHNTMHV